MNWAEGAEGSGVQSVVASGSGTANDTVFRASTPSGQQYFLVENRQPVGYDLGLEGYLGTNFTGGLAIWHMSRSGQAPSAAQAAFRQGRE